MSFLPKGHRLRRLQRHRNVAEAPDQSRQDLLTQAQRQLRELPEKGEKGHQARQIYGAVALYRVIVGQ